MQNLKPLSEFEPKNSILNEDKHAFNYDVQAMQSSIESGKIAVPDFENAEDFLNWL